MDPRVEEAPFARDHDSVDDFEHLSHDGTTPDYRPERHRLIDTSCVDDLLHIGDSLQQAPDSALPKALATDGGDEAKPVPATPPPSADLDEAQDPFEQPMRTVDPKLASMTFVETERSAAHHAAHNDDHALQQPFTADLLLSSSSSKVITEGGANEGQSTEERVATTDTGPGSANVDEFRDVRPLKQPEKPDNFVREELFGRAAKNIMDDDSWNLVEQADARRAKEAPTKPLPPLPKDAELPEKSVDLMSGDTPFAEAKTSPPSSQQATDSESAKWRQKPKEPDYICTRPPAKKKQEIEIAPKEIFRDMGLDAWFNPEQLNPKVAALIYWRDPKKSGIVFGTILGVLLSLAYFSLISVLAYLSLLVLTGTVLFRVYKTVLQAVQKTSDGHPFKDILDVDLALPAEKVHEVADVAVAHINAVIGELRRLFLVEDLVDSLKFGVLLWCLTYVGSWFNGMTLIIIGVVALFTLPKIYETNKEQIDQNLALVQAKINEVTAKVKAAIPLGKKAEPTKEE